MTKQITLYGIKNCDTMTKARKWLEVHQVDFSFYDYKKSPVTEALIQTFLTQLTLDELINRRGLTWRKLSEVDKARVNDPQQAILLLTEYSSLIKRPILQIGNAMIVGFDETKYTQFLLENTNE